MKALLLFALSTLLLFVDAQVAGRSRGRGGVSIFSGSSAGRNSASRTASSDSVVLSSAMVVSPQPAAFVAPAGADAPGVVSPVVSMPEVIDSSVVGTAPTPSTPDSIKVPLLPPPPPPPPPSVRSVPGVAPGLPGPVPVPAPVPVPVPAPKPTAPSRPRLIMGPRPTTPAPEVLSVPTVQIIPLSDELGQATAPGTQAATFGFSFDGVFSNAAPAQVNGGQANQGVQNDGLQRGAQSGGSALIKPYVVSLRRRSDLGYFCAGVLIGRRHVLSAAHCLDSSLAGGDTQPEVVVGSTRLSQTSGLGIQVISTENVFFSPSISDGQPDLAILKLAARSNQPPIRLPNSPNFTPNNGETLTGIGWGRTSTQSAFSDLVQFFQTTFVPSNVCSDSLNRGIPAFNLCVGGEGGSSCDGDNGGPIIAERNRDLLVGIVGRQHACGQPVIDVHNRIAPVIKWIRDTRTST